MSLTNSNHCAKLSLSVSLWYSYLLERFYMKWIEEHIENNEQMLFISGPRQVGKTTLAKQLLKKRKYGKYFNWDILKHRELILSGAFEEELMLDIKLEEKRLVVFDEIHKYVEWKNWLKGFYDEHKGKIAIVVTGSAKLDSFMGGGDSLMGRYFHYNIHPLSINELQNREPYENNLISAPLPLKNNSLDELLEYGGFPEPFLKRNKEFSAQWNRYRFKQLLQEDIRDLTKVSDLARLEVLMEILKRQSTKMTSCLSLSKLVRVSDNTIRKWLDLLKSLYFCYTIKPWSRNISRSIIKEGKTYLWDWALVKDTGSRIENLVANHLKKAVAYWNDSGKGDFGLYFLRDREKREVDFLIVKEDEPWIMIEVKSSYRDSISSSIRYFKQKLSPKYSFQLAYDLEYQDVDCFSSISSDEVSIVSMETFLSQLV